MNCTTVTVYNIVKETVRYSRVQHPTQHITDNFKDDDDGISQRRWLRNTRWDGAKKDDKEGCEELWSVLRGCTRQEHMQKEKPAKAHNTLSRNQYQNTRTGFLQVSCNSITICYGTEIWYELEHCSTPCRKLVQAFWYRFLSWAYGRHSCQGVCLPWLSYPLINWKHLWHQSPKCHHSWCNEELRKSDLEVTARHLNEVEAVQHVHLTNIPVWFGLLGDV